ncbi:Suppressor of fused protein (SUFU) [Erwinia sp. OLTSP20]|uniref:suppressor of fused domain protein n=1 Tax=unclassified Erwinia TaxID=2622719 RepID=UPI000C177387|nr:MULTISPECIES: suppressor of fused domain protein [unclassified Erwinia]PIJ48846.1 Suppressor of fused protein (SUFU) [Erwinia sp. OAMSP11]PIJ69468.1 Suppressor of fused protein (SUFU) [Erwinia sp. OLSSP12]PIJ79302.1 Suppressor of fused protein (SUFU) [Erwinia sp. OLCASP19]PIJ80828.1 Suppressor of fused protein (SUFU) [Erwinia sp. OLMTSP26]PIJ82980.1 Suppressor of fused protein (SUFU) [Erwinia sp. OLMDSP33]
MTGSPPLLEVTNPQQTLIAVVEQDQRTAYFYLWPAQSLRSRFAVRGCWLRNLLPAPLQEDLQAIEQGIPPLLSAADCRTLGAEPPLDAAGLQVIWEPAGDGAALWYQGQLLAVIPGWSLYQQQQVSFSAGCIRENRLTAPLGSASTNDYYARAERHRLFWRDWRDDHLWDSVQRTLLQCYEQQFGESLRYYAIHQDDWPPMAISQHFHQGNWIFLTLGMSIRPMPWVDFLYQDLAPDYRRCELAMAIDAQVMTEENAVHMASALARFAPFPWQQIDWLGEGHTLLSDVAPPGFEGFILSATLADEQARFMLPPREGEKVNLLWTVPVTSAERGLVQADDNGGEQLISRLVQAGIGHVFRPRKSVTELRPSQHPGE